MNRKTSTFLKIRLPTKIGSRQIIRNQKILLISLHSKKWLPIKLTEPIQSCEIGSRQIYLKSVLVSQFTIKNWFPLKLAGADFRTPTLVHDKLSGTNPSCKSIYNQKLVPDKTAGNRFQNSKSGSRRICREPMLLANQFTFKMWFPITLPGTDSRAPESLPDKCRANQFFLRISLQSKIGSH